MRSMAGVVRSVLSDRVDARHACGSIAPPSDTFQIESLSAILSTTWRNNKGPPFTSFAQNQIRVSPPGFGTTLEKVTHLAFSTPKRPRPGLAADNKPNQVSILKGGAKKSSTFVSCVTRCPAGIASAPSRGYGIFTMAPYTGFYTAEASVAERMLNF